MQTVARAERTRERCGSLTGTRLCITENPKREDTSEHTLSSWNSHQLQSTRNATMNTADENHMEPMETEPEETHRHMPVDEGPSSSCRGIRGKFKPKLKTTKSFPPYSQCIGGLGGDGDSDDELNPDLVTASPSNVGEDRPAETQITEKKAEQSSDGSWEAMKAKWRIRRRERLGGSYDVNRDGWEKGRWSGKRVEKNEKERECDDKEREGAADNEGNHWRGFRFNFGKSRKEEKEKERKGSPISVVKGESNGSVETPEGKEEDADGMREGMTHRHPVLSKLLHSSSSTSSSCSSINLSSAESDEVFSEGEDAASKRKNFKKSRSWKTYLTMMHWSLRRQSSWVQLAGHQGNFQLSKVGEILKLYSEPEAKCLDCLMRDPLRPFVPQFHGLITRGEHCYMRLEDLLNGLRRPVIMDCKMGVRTYQEEELIKARNKTILRSDMYQKMVTIDASAPSAEEHEQKGVTKWRYLQWRDTTTSTSTLGFRIEGIMMEDGSIQRDFKKIQTLAQVTDALLFFTRSQLDTLNAYHSRLVALRDALRNSTFFRTHEVIGSSLLFVHDHSKASVWMIDFGKTTPLPDTKELQHNVPWAEGSREDGYLIGLTSLTTALSQAISVALGQQEDSCEEEKSVT